MSLTFASIFGLPSSTPALYGAIAGTIIVGLLMMYGLMNAPPRWRRPVVGTVTFLAGAVYVAYFLWPKAQSRGPHDMPLNASEGVAFWLQDAVTTVGDLANTLTAFLLGLGIYSLLRIHGKRLFGMQRDWFFSLVLLISMFAIVLFGYWNWHDVKFGPEAALMQDPANWHGQNYTFDLLFDGLLQQMDAAMFSIIAFFILSAAYRAFRVRSVEATILLATALIVMLSLMGAVEVTWNNAVHGAGLSSNFQLTEISKWIRDTFQTSSLRALDFGVGLGALAMGLRLWLSLERGGVSS